MIFEYEKYYINKFGKDNLCNLADGGGGWSGLHHSDEAKKKMSIASKNRESLRNKRTKETRLKMSIAHKGKKFSKEHLAKLSEVRKNKVPWNKGLSGDKLMKYINESRSKHMEVV